MKKVLLVDESSSFTQYLTFIIKRLGYETLVVHRGADCLDATSRGAPDMVMCEAHLPDMDGLELCRALRANPGTGNVPVVFVTTDGHDGTRQAAMESGAVDFLTKPVKTRSVFTVLETHVGHRRRRQIRTPYVTHVEVDDGDGGTRMLQTSNLGEGGMFIKSEEPHPVGRVLDLRFYLNGHPRAFTVKGEVLYAMATKGDGVAPGMGVRFLGLAPEEQSALSSHIERYVSGAMVNA